MLVGGSAQRRCCCATMKPKGSTAPQPIACLCRKFDLWGCRKEGAVEVRSQGEAQQAIQAAADAIHGLGRGGNVPQAPPQAPPQASPAGPAVQGTTICPMHGITYIPLRCLLHHLESLCCMLVSWTCHITSADDVTGTQLILSTRTALERHASALHVSCSFF